MVGDFFESLMGAGREPSIGVMSRDEFGQYMGEHRLQDEIWVGMNDFKWADHDLATMAAGPCLVPVFIHPKKKRVGLGHLSYTFIDEDVLNTISTLRQKFHEIIDDMRSRVIKEKGWIMYLFAGRPEPVLGDMEAGMKRAETNKREFISIFSSVGVQCVDKTAYMDPSKSLNGIITNPQSIRYLYE